MYTATPLSKHGQYASHICDCWWPPAHPQHNTTHNHDNDEIDNNNNKKYKEWQQQHHNHHNHHLQPRYLHQRLDNGSNDASRVIWAHGKFFYFSLRVFLILNIMYSYYWSIQVTEGLREGGGEENRPKRRDTRCLGHSVSFLFFSLCFFYILTIIVKLQRLRLYGGPLRSLRRGKRAQTTRIASFGPLVSVF